MSQVLKIDDIIERIINLKNNDVDAEIIINKPNKILTLELSDEVYTNNTSKLDNLDQISKKYDKIVDEPNTQSTTIEYKNIQKNKATKIDSSIEKHYRSNLTMNKIILTSFGIPEKNNIYKKIKKSGYGIFW